MRRVRRQRALSRSATDERLRSTGVATSQCAAGGTEADVLVVAVTGAARFA